MAGLGFSLPRLPQSSLIGSEDIPMSDKLMAVASILHGHPEAAMQIRMLAQARAQLAAQEGAQGDLSRAISGGGIPQLTPAPDQSAPPPQEPAVDPKAAMFQGLAKSLGSGLTEDASPLSVPRISVAPSKIPMLAPAQSRQGGPASVRALLPQLTRFAQLGGNIEPYVKMLEAAQPKVQFDRGFGYDERDAAAAKGYHPDLEKDQIPLYDPEGRFAGVKNADGSVTAAAQMAGAISDAQERAKATYDLKDIPMRNGSTVTLPRLKAIERLGGGSAAVPSGAGPIPDGFGVSQTPAEKVAAEGHAKTGVERDAAQPQAYAGLTDQDRASEITATSLHEILGDVRDPKTGAWHPGPNGGGMLNWATTGFGANLAGLKGTPAHNLQAKLDQVRAATGFDELSKMRQNSPTGGALGQVSEQENRLLQSVRGSLDQGQAGPQLAEVLRGQLAQLEKLRAQRQTLYQGQYAGRGAKAQAGPSRAAIEAEMRRRGLLQ
jgi:hypothetical protein